MSLAFTLAVDGESEEPLVVSDERVEWHSQEKVRCLCRSLLLRQSESPFRWVDSESGVCVCVRACVRACVPACVRACMRVLAITGTKCYSS